MKTFAERCKDLYERARQSPAQMPSRVAILPDHVDEGKILANVFDSHEHYFQVRVNEMYLTYSRQWFNKYDPMVFIVSEFTYNKKEEVVPFVVGPMMMEKFGQKMPAGMIFANTRVAGLHPYRGGRLTLSVVLCRVKRDDYPQKLLQMIESAAGVLDFSTALSTYVKVAGVVLNGIEALLGLGDLDPLIGFRKEFDPDAGDVLKSNYLALIDMPDVNPEKLWVREKQLFYGNSLAEANPFRDADFVLYSIVQSPENKRSDVTTLPFYPLWERVQKEANSAIPDNWKNATANLAILYEEMMLSPDLTMKHANELYNDYEAAAKIIHERAVKRSQLGPGEESEPSELDAIRAKAVSILEM
jgi:hypothetical protein